MEGSFVPHSHAPYKGDGSESYTDHSFTSHPVMEKAMPLLVEAIENIGFDPASQKAFTIADYGAADGGTSMELIEQLIGKIKEMFGNEQEIQIYYEDQPIADYNALFRILHGLSNKETSSYLNKYKNVFVAACGTNFFSQCYPSESVHLGFSSTAAHWLSHRPCVLKSCISVPFTTDEVERNLFAKVAKNDWELFLVNRARELVPDGHLVVANIGTDEEGQFAGHTFRVKQSIEKNFGKYWRSLAEDDVITEEEFENTTLNAYSRTEKEFAAPFTDTESVVYKMNLKLLAMKTVILPCPHNTAWISSSNKEDETARQTYAKRLIAQIRAWSNGTFISGLSHTRSKKKKVPTATLR